MSKVIIAGSRSITDKDLVWDKIDKSEFNITEVVSGRANGVDTFGEEWAEKNDVDIKKFPYTDYLDDYPPKVAPLIRNNKMAEYADKAIIIWNGESTGTKDMIEKAEKHDLDLEIHRTDIKGLDEWV